MTAIQALTGIHPTKISRDSQGNLRWQENLTIQPYLADIINKMIAYELRDRYQTATEVLDAIAHKEAALPIMVAIPPAKPRLSRHWLAIAATVLLVIVIGILVFLR
ncbi:MAG: hypothetical protein HC890_14140 [Chloroflexaceae bacterium]|nr:hypothetical protein [Chloroflexaceae bacterium]